MRNGPVICSPIQPVPLCQSVGGVQMSRFIACLFLTTLIATTTPAQTPQTVPSSMTRTAEAELRATMEQIRKASLAGDTETAARCLTDDYVQTDISGYVQNKNTWLDEYFKPLAALI